MTAPRHEQASPSRAKCAASFDVRLLDLNDEKLMRRAIEIHELAFPGTPRLERQLRHNSHDAPKGSTFFGAFENDHLLGLNGFVRHSVFVSGRQSAVYQSCSTATDPAYRGRGIFTSIVRHAQSALATGALSIIGFPNENSMPIFIGQLGFRPVPLVRLLVPSLFMGSLCSAWARHRAREAETIYFDQDELVAWKQSPSGRSIAVHSYSDVSVWGYEYRSHKFGLPLNMFAVGGACVGMIKSSATPIKTAGNFRKPYFYSFITTPGSTMARAARGHAVRGDAFVFIDYPMQPGAASMQFEVSAGLADYF